MKSASVLRQLPEARDDPRRIRGHTTGQPRTVARRHRNGLLSGAGKATPRHRTGNIGLITEIPADQQALPVRVACGAGVKAQNDMCRPDRGFPVRPCIHRGRASSPAAALPISTGTAIKPTTIAARPIRFPVARPNVPALPPKCVFKKLLRFSSASLHRSANATIWQVFHDCRFSRNIDENKSPRLGPLGQNWKKTPKNLHFIKAQMSSRRGGCSAFGRNGTASPA